MEKVKAWFTTISKLFEDPFDCCHSKKRKLVIKGDCKDKCCCCKSCLIAYDEKSDDDSGSDIVITPSEVVVK